MKIKELTIPMAAKSEEWISEAWHDITDYSATSLQQLNDAAGKTMRAVMPPIADIILILLALFVVGILLFFTGFIIGYVVKDTSAAPIKMSVVAVSLQPTTTTTTTTIIINPSPTFASTTTSSSAASSTTTTTIRPRLDVDYIPVCNNSNPEMVHGVNCKFGRSEYYYTGDKCPA